MRVRYEINSDSFSNLIISMSFRNMLHWVPLLREINRNHNCTVWTAFYHRLFLQDGACAYTCAWYVLLNLLILFLSSKEETDWNLVLFIVNENDQLQFFICKKNKTQTQKTIQNRIDLCNAFGTCNKWDDWYVLKIDTTLTRWRKSTQFRRICLFKLDPTQEIYIPSNSQGTNLQIYTHVFSLAFKMVEKLTDLNWKWGSENIRPL